VPKVATIILQLFELMTYLVPDTYKKAIALNSSLLLNNLSTFDQEITVLLSEKVKKSKARLEELVAKMAKSTKTPRFDDDNFEAATVTKPTKNTPKDESELSITPSSRSLLPEGNYCQSCNLQLN
jgi:hypothetical protein